MFLEARLEGTGLFTCDNAPDGFASLWRDESDPAPTMEQVLDLVYCI